MDFFAQIGVGLVVVLILYIIIKSNKSLEKAYFTSEEQKMEKKADIKQGDINQENNSVKKQRVERSSHTIASDLVIDQEKRKKVADFCIWTIDAGGRLEDKIEVAQYPFTIGRADDNDFCIADNSVSSHHAQLVKEGEFVILKDMNSLNKIFVNGRQTLEVRVKDGLCVFLGNTELYFEENN